MVKNVNAPILQNLYGGPTIHECQFKGLGGVVWMCSEWFGCMDFMQLILRRKKNLVGKEKSCWILSNDQ